MEENYRGTESELQADVVVIGGGLAGQAAAIHLARSNMRVLCLEARDSFDSIVGESLDWSAPQLLAQLGLPMEELVASGAATYKRHIVITAPGGSQQHYLPGAWLASRPWNVETRTLHLDRQRVHALQQQLAKAHGVVTLHERAVGFEKQDKRIASVRTAKNQTIRASWFLDASGAAASMLGHEFSLPFVAYGPRKVSLWAHFPTPDWAECTTLYTVSQDGEYMEWMWEIPVSPGVTSVGYVAPGSTVKSDRARGLKNHDLLARQMHKFPRLRSLMNDFPPGRVAATSFLCRTYQSTCGPNWLIIGEAASQSDPITGNGVTAALRHAGEASALVIRYRFRGTIPLLARTAYNLRVSGVGRFFNSLIEKLFYQPPVRGRLGLFGAARAYTVPAWLTNLLYSRTRPRGLSATLILCSALVVIRAAVWTIFQCSRAASRSAHTHHTLVAAGETRRALHASR